jgi:hypothetical protein
MAIGDLSAGLLALKHPSHLITIKAFDAGWWFGNGANSNGYTGENPRWNRVGFAVTLLGALG